MEIAIHVDLVEAKNLLQEWKGRLAQLEGEAKTLRERIEKVHSQIDGQIRPPKRRGRPPRLAVVEAKTNNAKPPSKRQNRPRGENLSAIVDFLKKANGKGFTQTEIASKTGIGISSVQAAIVRAPQKFDRRSDKLWYLK
jgi:hypothetical protein